MAGLIPPPPPTKHVCEPPWDSTGYGATGQPDGTIWVCRCGQAWFSAYCYESLGPISHWRAVRWYHWRLRRRIREDGGQP